MRRLLRCAVTLRRLDNLLVRMRSMKLAMMPSFSNATREPFPSELRVGRLKEVERQQIVKACIDSALG